MTQNRNFAEHVRHLPESIAGDLPSTDAIRLTHNVLPLFIDDEPVPWRRFDALASQYERSGEVIDELRPYLELDDTGDVAGLMGLSLKETPHQCVVAGKTRYNWCAFDGLVLPVALARTAELHSVDPVTADPIHLMLTLDKIQNVDPAQTMLSVADPNLPEGGHGYFS